MSKCERRYEETTDSMTMSGERLDGCVKYNDNQSFVKVKSKKKIDKFKEKLIKIYEEKYQIENSLNCETLELFKIIKDIEFKCDILYKRIEKLFYNDEILKWFDDECMSEYNFELIIEDLNEILTKDALSIYYNFLNNKSTYIDSEADLQFYKNLKGTYEAVMF